MRQNKEAGYMFIGALLVLVILSIFGISMITLSLASVKTSQAEQKNQSAFYIAEAGLNYYVNWFQREATKIYQDETVQQANEFYNALDPLLVSDERYEDFEKVNNFQPYAEVSITKGSEADQFVVTSVGFLENESRTVTKTITVTWQDKNTDSGGEFELPPFAVFTSGNFLMNNGTIIGDIGTVNSNVNGVSFPGGGPTLNGKAYVPDGRQDIVQRAHYIQVEVAEIDPQYQIPNLPPFPDFPDYSCPENETIAVSQYNQYEVIKDCNLRIDNWIVRDTNYTLTMDRNMKFKEMRFESNYTLRIDVGDHDREIVVDNLNMKNGHIVLLGTGNLTIYVNDEMNFGSGSTINLNGDISRVNVFYKGKANKQNLEFAGAQKVYGSLYAEKANIKITAGAGFVGNVFTGGNEVTLSGGTLVTTQLVFAPNATVKMLQGGKLKGMIIAHHFENTGGATVEHQTPFVISGPISPAALGYNDGGSGGSGGGSGSDETPTKPIFSLSKLKEIVD